VKYQLKHRVLGLESDHHSFVHQTFAGLVARFHHPWRKDADELSFKLSALFMPSTQMPVRKAVDILTDYNLLKKVRYF